VGGGEEGVTKLSQNLPKVLPKFYELKISKKNTTLPISHVS